MNNENNIYMAIFTGCIMIILSFYVTKELKTKNAKNIALALLACAISVIIYGVVTYKRNFEAFEMNEQEYIDWDASRLFVYGISGIILIVSMMLAYENYSTDAHGNAVIQESHDFEPRAFTAPESEGGSVGEGSDGANSVRIP